MESTSNGDVDRSGTAVAGNVVWSDDPAWDTTIVPFFSVAVANEEVTALFSELVEEGEGEARVEILAGLSRTGGTSDSIELDRVIEPSGLEVVSGPLEIADSCVAALLHGDVELNTMTLLDTTQFPDLIEVAEGTLSIRVPLEANEVTLFPADVDVVSGADVALLSGCLLDFHVLETVTGDDSLTGGDNALMVLRLLDILEPWMSPSVIIDVAPDHGVLLVVDSVNVAEITVVMIDDSLTGGTST